MTLTAIPFSNVYQISARIICIALILVIHAFIPAGLTDATGAACPVLRVVDGDTIVVLFNGKKEKIRMLNVDTPESVHPDRSRNTVLGKQAAAYTRQRLAGREVTLEFEEQKRGKYGRLLAYVIIDRENFNLELVRQGWSPYYTKYGKSPRYHDRFKGAEAEARTRRRNIWEPSKVAAAREQSAFPMASAALFHGNTGSHVFHHPGCRYFNCKNCTRTFSNREAAVAAGYSPCRICRP